MLIIARFKFICFFLNSKVVCFLAFIRIIESSGKLHRARKLGGTAEVQLRCGSNARRRTASMGLRSIWATVQDSVFHWKLIIDLMAQ